MRLYQVRQSYINDEIKLESVDIIKDNPKSWRVKRESASNYRVVVPKTDKTVFTTPEAAVQKFIEESENNLKFYNECVVRYTKALEWAKEWKPE